MRISSIMFASALAVAASAGIAHAGANLITNGDFSETSPTINVSTQFGASAVIHNRQFVTGWTGNNGYEIWFPSATAATTDNTVGQYSFTRVEKLWSVQAPPSGPGTFIGLDGAQIAGVQSSIEQTLRDLSVGSTYQVSFDWAGAQMRSRTGPTTEALAVSFGTSTQSTVTIDHASKGFTGWQTDTMQFVANSANEVLSFLAVGSPSGLPPMSLLTNVSVQKVAVPEPSSLALLGGGLVGLGLVLRRRRSARRGGSNTKI